MLMRSRPCRDLGHIKAEGMDGMGGMDGDEQIAGNLLLVVSTLYPVLVNQS